MPASPRHTKSPGVGARAWARRTCIKLEHLRWLPVHSGTLAQMLLRAAENRRSLVRARVAPHAPPPKSHLPSRLGKVMHFSSLRFPPPRRHTFAQAEPEGMAPRNLPCCTGPVSRESTQPDATEATFRQLAQDSHRLWSTLEFRHTNPDRGTVHAWLRRPYDLRVEAGDGTIFVANQRPGTPGASWQMSFTGQGDETLAQQAEDALYAGTPPPAGVKVSWAAPADHDPMYENYEWVAMLRPYELGRGQWHDPGPNDGNDNTAVDAATPAPGVVIHHVGADDRHGRDTWWAEVSLDPRSYELSAVAAHFSSTQRQRRGSTAITRSPLSERATPLPTALGSRLP